MQRYITAVIDAVQPIKNFLKIYAARFIEWPQSGINRTAHPGSHRHIAIGIRDVILQIDIKEIRCKAFEGIGTVVFPTQSQISRLVNNPKIRSVNTLKCLNRSRNSLKKTLGMRLMCQTYIPLGCLVGCALGVRDICVGLNTDAQQIATKCICQIEMRGNIAQTLRSLGTILGYGKIAGCH